MKIGFYIISADFFIDINTYITLETQEFLNSKQPQ